MFIYNILWKHFFIFKISSEKEFCWEAIYDSEAFDFCLQTDWEDCFPLFLYQNSRRYLFENNMHIYPNFLSLKNEEIAFQHSLIHIHLTGLFAWLMSPSPISYNPSPTCQPLPLTRAALPLPSKEDYRSLVSPTIYHVEHFPACVPLCHFPSENTVPEPSIIFRVWPDQLWYVPRNRTVQL